MCVSLSLSLTLLLVLTLPFLSPRVLPHFIDYTSFCITNPHTLLLVCVHSFPVVPLSFLPGPCGNLPIDVLPASPRCGRPWLHTMTFSCHVAAVLLVCFTPIFILVSLFVPCRVLFLKNKFGHLNTLNCNLIKVIIYQLYNFIL